LRPRHIVIGLCALLAILAGLSGLGSWRERQGHAGEIQSAVHQGEAQAHVQAAESVPDHSQALASAKADSARAWAEVRRLRKLVDAKAPALPDPAVPPATGGEPAADLRTQQLLAADRELIEAQARENQALKLALSDEKKRSSEFKAAFESERKATAAQQAATEAWKKAVTTSRWQGRIEGFAAGAALGFVGGRR
jgi:hypothetical protein